MDDHQKIAEAVAASIAANCHIEPHEIIRDGYVIALRRSFRVALADARGMSQESPGQYKIVRQSDKVVVLEFTV